MTSASQLQSNVSQEELDKFNNIANSWWDINGEFRPLHLMNPIRLNYITSKLFDLKDKDIIDVGCGGGILAESLAKKCRQATGIDLAQDSLNIAKLHALESQVSNIDYYCVSAEQQAANNAEQYDIVTCMEMLEHVPDPESIVAAVAKMCKPGGLVFFSTLNKTIKSYLLAIIAAEQVLNIVPKGTHEHNKFIKPSTLIGWAEKHGLKVKECVGLDYNPFNESFKITKNVKVNYIIYCEKIA